MSKKHPGEYTGDPYQAGVVRIICVNPKTQYQQRMVESVARACGSCHVVFQNLFDDSPIA